MMQEIGRNTTLTGINHLDPHAKPFKFRILENVENSARKDTQQIQEACGFPNNALVDSSLSHSMERLCLSTNTRPLTQPSQTRDDSLPEDLTCGYQGCRPKTPRPVVEQHIGLNNYVQKSDSCVLEIIPTSSPHSYQHTKHSADNLVGPCTSQLNPNSSFPEIWPDYEQSFPTLGIPVQLTSLSRDELALPHPGSVPSLNFEPGQDKTKSIQPNPHQTVKPVSSPNCSTRTNITKVKEISVKLPRKSELEEFKAIKQELRFQKSLMKQMTTKRETVDFVSLLNQIDLKEDMEHYQEIPSCSEVLSVGCPNSRADCDYGSVVWNCVDCMMTVHYDLKAYIYCCCGRSLIQNCRFKCLDVNHGHKFVRFECDAEFLNFCRNGIDDAINVLLIGETRSGKSTLINAISNYLQYETLEETNQHSLVMPSATMDQLETTKCRSYQYRYKDKLFRFIDTPGIGGDKRKDDKTLFESTLSYVSQYPTIRAVCLVTDSRSSNTDRVYDGCIREFINFIPHALNSNFLLIVTRAKTHDMRPGQALSDLIEVINGDYPTCRKKLIINRRNVFRLDNDLFKYLCNLDNQISLTFYEVRQFGFSFEESRDECFRLMDILANLKPIEIKILVFLHDIKRMIYIHVPAFITACLEYQKILYILNTFFRGFDTEQKSDRSVSSSLYQRHLHLVKKYNRYLQVYKLYGKRAEILSKNKILSKIHPTDSLSEFEADKLQLENEQNQLLNCLYQFTVYMRVNSVSHWTDIIEIDLKNLVLTEQKKAKKEDRTHLKLVNRLKKLLENYQLGLKKAEPDLRKLLPRVGENQNDCLQAAWALLCRFEEIYNLGTCGKIVQSIVKRTFQAEKHVIDLSPVKKIYSDLRKTLNISQKSSASSYNKMESESQTGRISCSANSDQLNQLAFEEEPAMEEKVVILEIVPCEDTIEQNINPTEKLRFSFDEESLHGSNSSNDVVEENEYESDNGSVELFTLDPEVTVDLRCHAETFECQSDSEGLSDVMEIRSQYSESDENPISYHYEDNNIVLPVESKSMNSVDEKPSIDDVMKSSSKKYKAFDSDSSSPWPSLASNSPMPNYAIYTPEPPHSQCYSPLFVHHSRMSNSPQLYNPAGPSPGFRDLVSTPPGFSPSPCLDSYGHPNYPIPQIQYHAIAYQLGLHYESQQQVAAPDLQYHYQATEPYLRYHCKSSEPNLQYHYQATTPDLQYHCQSTDPSVQYHYQSQNNYENCLECMDLPRYITPDYKNIREHQQLETDCKSTSNYESSVAPIRECCYTPTSNKLAIITKPGTVSPPGFFNYQPRHNQPGIIPDLISTPETVQSRTCINLSTQISFQGPSYYKPHMDQPSPNPDNLQYAHRANIDPLSQMAHNSTTIKFFPNYSDLNKTYPSVSTVSHSMPKPQGTSSRHKFKKKSPRKVDSSKIKQKMQCC